MLKLELANNMDYFKHPFFSNSKASDLGQELGLLFSFNQDRDAQFENFRLGTLFDILETEPERIDRLWNKIWGTEYEFTDEELKLYENKQQLLYKDPYYSKLLWQKPDFQKEIYEPEFTLDGIFKVGFKGKLDLFLPHLIIDLKTTKCTTLNAFKNTCNMFGYFRQMIYYMKLTGTKKSVLIGISKVVNKIFIVEFDSSHEAYNENFEMCRLLIEKQVLLK